MAIKTSINLLQSELFPEKKLLTLPRMVGLWMIVLIVMITWAVFNDFQNKNIAKKHRHSQTENKRQSALVANLEQQLASRRADTELTDKLDTIKLLLQQKSALHTKLTNTQLTFVSGFAMAMDELSAMHHKDIRLQGINIRNDDMYFTGFAKSPEAVPAWLDGFQQSTLLSGKSFVGFKLSKNDDDITEFVVSSKVDKDTNK
jgi:hypothetical protein